MTLKTTEGSSTSDRLWTVSDVATFLGVPVRTLYQWRYHRCGPPGYRVGRHVRYDPTMVKAWLEDQHVIGGRGTHGR